MLYAALAFFVTLSLALLVRLYFVVGDLCEIKMIVAENADLYPDQKDTRYSPAVRDMRVDMERIGEIVQ